MLPPPRSTLFPYTTLFRSAAVTLPNDPNLYAQYWGHNMVDLPRAWAITTGSPNVIVAVVDMGVRFDHPDVRSEEHTSELQSPMYLVCRLLLEKKNRHQIKI